MSDAQPNDLEARKNELFATMTLIKAAKHDLAMAQLAGAGTLPLIDRLSDLESDRERLAHEVNSQYMYRNLSAFMDRVEAYEAARQSDTSQLTAGQAGIRDALEVASADLKKEVGDQGLALNRALDLLDVLSETQRDHAGRLDAHDARFEAVEARVTRTEQALAKLRAWQARLDEWRNQLGGS